MSKLQNIEKKFKKLYTKIISISFLQNFFFFLGITCLFVVDNSYYYVFIKYGLLFSFIFYYQFSKTSMKLMSQKCYKDIYIIILFCIYSFIEALIVHPQIAIVGLFI